MNKLTSQYKDALKRYPELMEAMVAEIESLEKDNESLRLSTPKTEKHILVMTMDMVKKKQNWNKLWYIPAICYAVFAVYDFVYFFLADSMGEQAYYALFFILSLIMAGLFWSWAE